MINVGLSVTNLQYISMKNDYQDLWYQDCGATQHMTLRNDWLKNYTVLQEPEKVMIGDSTLIEGVGVGDIDLLAYNGQDLCNITLKNVLYTPKIPFNLFSITSALDKGYRQEADTNCSYFFDSDTG